MLYRGQVTQTLPRQPAPQINESSRLTAIQLRDAQCRIAPDAYKRAEFEFGGSMTSLAQKLGFEVIGTAERLGRCVGNEILYWEELAYTEVNAFVAMALARALLARAGLASDVTAVRLVADRLMLPSAVAAELEPDELAAANPHVPLDSLRHAYFSAEGSGEMPAVG